MEPYYIEEYLNNIPVFYKKSDTMDAENCNKLEVLFQLPVGMQELQDPHETSLMDAGTILRENQANETVGVVAAQEVSLMDAGNYNQWRCGTIGSAQEVSHG